MIEIYKYIIGHPYEFSGVIFSILYVCFSIKQNILCWPALIIAAILNGYAFYLIELPLQSMMQLFFIGVGFSGWKQWNKKNTNKILVQRWSMTQTTLFSSFGLLATFILYQGLLQLEGTSLQSKYPFFDSLIFIFNVMPMYMTTKKIIQSWLIFIAIDIVSGCFYFYTEDYFYCFLFFFYIPFATYGYLNWKKDLICKK